MKLKIKSCDLIFNVYFLIIFLIILILFLISILILIFYFNSAAGISSEHYNKLVIIFIRPRSRCTTNRLYLPDCLFVSSEETVHIFKGLLR